MDAAEPLDESLSLCPECFATVGCVYEERDGAVWQTKECPRHGRFESRYWGDAEHYRWTQSFSEAGTPDAACDPADGCCPEGEPGRRRCLAVIDVTQNCNLACSYCFASSRPGLPEVPRATIRGLLETVLRESGGPSPIQLSGGEPTTRDDLPDIVHDARQLGFTHIEVNSNGVRLAEEDGYAEALAAAGVTTVYLQFDGFGRKVYGAIRDAPGLEKTKRRAVERCRAAGLPVILVPTVVKGANEHQLGLIVDYALANLDTVRGVNFQPVSHFGRHADDTGHLSLPDIANLLAEQTGFLRQRDLMQVPCCSPQCSSATMLLATGADRKGRHGAMPLTRFVSEEAYRDVVAAFEEKQFMDVLAGRPEGIDAARVAADCCGITVPDGLDRFLPRMLAVTVTGFMDADTVDLARLGKCCINVPTPEGQLVPFCGYNLTTRDGRYALRDQYKRQATRPIGGLPVLPR